MNSGRNELSHCDEHQACSDAHVLSQGEPKLDLCEFLWKSGMLIYTELTQRCVDFLCAGVVGRQSFGQESQALCLQNDHMIPQKQLQ